MDLTPESVFGGAILIPIFLMLVTGKLRFEREVKRELEAKDEIIGIKDNTINEHIQTIRTLTERDEVTHHLLRELRDIAMGKQGDPA